MQSPQKSSLEARSWHRAPMHPDYEEIPENRNIEDVPVEGRAQKWL